METLPTTSTTKSDRRGGRAKAVQTSKPSLIMAFFSCVAWLYVAGRLWQDAENRNLLASLLKKNSAQRPKVLTVEDKLMVLGCRDLERRIVEAEMELTLAKSQGYLKGQLQQTGSSSDRRLLAVIGVYTGFGSRLKRNIFRGSWMPRGDALKKLEERGVVIRFVIGRSANRGDSLDRNIDEENRSTKDFVILEGHEEAQEELPKKAKIFFSTAVQNWDADFYVKVDDNIDIDLEGLIELLDRRRGQDGAYIGCMKSGEVISEEGKPWYEPEWWKFGDEKTYFRHAAGSLVILSKNLVQYININSVSLKTYGYDDTSLGSWMMGIQATYIDDSRLCCSSIRQGDCQYPLDKVRVSQSPTGALIHDKPEWKLTISNTIPCSLQNLTLACTGFQTVEEVDPSIMAKVGDKCLIYNGQPVYPFSSVNFNYAWDTSFPFRVVYAQITCS